MKNRIKEIRESKLVNGKRLSGRKVAEHLGISHPYYYGLEKGHKNLSADMASKLADLFDVSVDYLLCKDVQEDKNEQFKHDVTELSLEELLDKYDLQYKGEKLTEAETKFMIQNLRSFREFRN